MAVDVRSLVAIAVRATSSSWSLCSSDTCVELLLRDLFDVILTIQFGTGGENAIKKVNG